MQNFLAKRMSSLSCLICLSVSALVNAQESKETLSYANKALRPCEISNAQEVPVIDGDLGDAIWSHHNSHKDLYQIKPVEYGEASEQTEFWVCYDKEFLYVAAYAHMKQPEKIVARQHIQGKEFEEDDQIHISIDSYHQQKEAYFFQVNPNGMRNDALAADRPDGFRVEWDAPWFAGSKITEGGWTTEIKIPFRVLGFDSANQAWGFNIGRVIRYNNETLIWNSRGAGVWEMGAPALGTLKPIENPSIGRGIDVIGTVTQKNQMYKTSDIPEQTKHKNETKPSLDVFYRPISGLTLSATLNTDFSSADDDERVINFDRFDIFVPEKRDFFLRDSGRFGFGDIYRNGLPFISRRMGLASDGRPLDIHQGVKASGDFDSTQFGFIGVRQENAFDSDKTNDLMVARISQSLTDRLSVGGVHTQGSPDDVKNAATNGLDVLYNLRDLETFPIRMSAWVQQSDTDLISRDNRAFGSRFWVSKPAWELGIRQTNMEKNFKPELGFVNRSDVRQNESWGEYRWYFADPVLQMFYIGYWGMETTDFKGNLESKYLELYPLQFKTTQGDQLYVERIQNFERLKETFAPIKNVSFVPGDYAFDFDLVNFKSSRSRRLFTEIELGRGDYFSAESRKYKMVLGTRPTDRLLFKISYTENNILLNNGKNVQSRIAVYKHEIALTDTWSWVATVQYDNLSRRAGSNQRLQWKPDPYTELFLVVNQVQEDLIKRGDFDTRERMIALKLSHRWGW